MTEFRAVALSLVYIATEGGKRYLPPLCRNRHPPPLRSFALMSGTPHGMRAGLQLM